MKECIKCKSDEAKKWYSGPQCDKCYRKEWYQNNKDSKHQQDRKRDYYKSNKEEIKQKTSEYSKSNRKSINKTKREWYQNNKDSLPDRSEYHREYFRNRYNNDIKFKIKVNLRNRLNNAIKNKQKTGSAVKDLGCSVEELKKHLESKFVEGMSWDNYGDWHIDHIKALANYNLEDREELLKACSYKNLQPLWAEDNFKKSDS